MGFTLFGSAGDKKTSANTTVRVSERVGNITSGLTSAAAVQLANVFGTTFGTYQAQTNQLLASLLAAKDRPITPVVLAPWPTIPQASPANEPDQFAGLAQAAAAPAAADGGGIFGNPLMLILIGAGIYFAMR